MSDLTHEDVQRILAIIDTIGDRTVSFEYGDIKLHMTRSGDDSGARQPTSAATAAGTATSSGAMASSAARASATAQSQATLTAQSAAATPAPAVSSAESATPTTSAPAAAKTEVPEGMIAVTAPTSGTFYRAGSPTAKPFVEVGDHVEANDTVAIFDVMKLFMSLRAGVAGTVTAILVENQAVAEQEQPLMLIRPD